MIGTSTTEYNFIRSCVFFLHNIAPVSVLYCVLLLLYPVLPPTVYVYRAPFPMEVWLLAEAVFFTVFFLPYRCYLQRPAIHPEPLSREERQKLFKRCNAIVKDPDKYLSQWLLGAKKEDIKRENVKDFMRWAFLDTAEATEKDEEEIEGYITATEELLGRKLPPGKSSAKSLRLTLDKVDCLHRSLLWYFCISVVDAIAYCSMSYNSFHFHRSSLRRLFTLFPFRPLVLFSRHKSPVEHLTYWHRPHKSKTRLPVLFIHGIGIGLYPYTIFLRDLDKAGEAEGDDAGVGIIALEIMPVSSRITHPALNKDVIVGEIQAIVKHHGWSRFVLVSHSYGSVISTHLLNSPLTSTFVGPIVFIDPISFLLHLPDVAYNFTARQPVQANEYLMWYFGSKDIGVAHTLARRFFWRENIVWMEDLLVDAQKGDNRRITVVLSERDLIVNTEAIGQYLTASSSEELLANCNAVGMINWNWNTRITKIVNQMTGEWNGRPWKGSGLEILWFAHLDHGQVFDFEKARMHVIKAIREYSVNS